MIELARSFPPPLDRLHTWQPGDAVTHLDGRPIADILDLYFYVPECEQAIITLRRTDGQTCRIELPPDCIGELTDCLAPLEFRTCACQCVFCFVDQNPDHLRETIYVKDEDYRFSFLYGNYITLTSTGSRGIERIKQQKLSPLFVSVHATGTELRTRMLGIKRQLDVVAILADLVAAGVEIHTQVVLCPGWNDGPALEQTFRDLFRLAPGVGSIAVVPVGLTAHRDRLTSLDPVTPECARQVIQQVTAFQKEARKHLDQSFIYLSDEFYLLADMELPPAEQYDGFPQVDNAIGLIRHLEQAWSDDLEWLQQEGRLPTLPITILTSSLAVTALRRSLLPLASRTNAPDIELVEVTNGLLGNTVTVAGLLSGRDLREALLRLPPQPQRTVILSPRVFNSDDLTLDDMRLDDIAADQPHNVLVPEDEDGFITFWADLS